MNQPDAKSSELNLYGNSPYVKKIKRNDRLSLWERAYLPEVCRGIAVTSKHFFRNMFGFIFPPKGKKRSIFTVYYPEERVTTPQAYRGRPVLVLNPDGQERCVACGLCEAICPAGCITIFGQERKPNDRYPEEYRLDMARCIFCGYCEEVCPKEAILMSDEYQNLAVYKREDLLFDKKRLLVPVEKLKSRIEYVRRIYAKWNY